MRNMSCGTITDGACCSAGLAPGCGRLAVFLSIEQKSAGSRRTRRTLRYRKREGSIASTPLRGVPLRAVENSMAQHEPGGLMLMGSFPLKKPFYVTK